MNDCAGDVVGIEGGAVGGFGGHALDGTAAGWPDSGSLPRFSPAAVGQRVSPGRLEGGQGLVEARRPDSISMRPSAASTASSYSSGGTRNSLAPSAMAASVLWRTPPTGPTEPSSSMVPVTATRSSPVRLPGRQPVEDRQRERQAGGRAADLAGVDRDVDRELVASSGRPGRRRAPADPGSSGRAPSSAVDRHAARARRAGSPRARSSSPGSWAAMAATSSSRVVIGLPSAPTTVMPGLSTSAAGERRVDVLEERTRRGVVVDLVAQPLERHLPGLVLRVGHQLQVEAAVLLAGLGAEERRRRLDLRRVVATSPAGR